MRKKVKNFRFFTVWNCWWSVAQGYDSARCLHMLETDKLCSECLFNDQLWFSRWKSAPQRYFQTKIKKIWKHKKWGKIEIFKLSKIKISCFFSQNFIFCYNDHKVLLAHSGRSVGVFGWGFGVLSDLNCYSIFRLCVLITCSVSSTDVQTRGMAWFVVQLTLWRLFRCRLWESDFRQSVWV